MQYQFFCDEARKSASDAQSLRPPEIAWCSKKCDPASSISWQIGPGGLLVISYFFG
jgi:hypothetical protein